MCYHISVPSKQKIEKAFDYAEFKEPWEEVNHLTAFSFSSTPIITSEDPGRIQLYSWGLIPKWVKDESQASNIKKQTLNARSETIFEKSSFRSSITKKRCLIIVNGFFEWRHFNENKYPYFIYLIIHKDKSLV